MAQTEVKDSLPSGATFQAGGPFAYQLSVSAGEAADNTFGADAQTVVVTDSVPLGLTPTSASASQGTGCTIAGTTVTCDLGTVAGPIPGPGPRPATITINGTVASSAAGTVTNTANVATRTSVGVGSTITASVTKRYRTRRTSSCSSLLTARRSLPALTPGSR